MKKLALNVASFLAGATKDLLRMAVLCIPKTSNIISNLHLIHQTNSVWILWYVILIKLSTIESCNCGLIHHYFKSSNHRKINVNMIDWANLDNRNFFDSLLWCDGQLSPNVCKIVMSFIALNIEQWTKPESKILCRFQFCQNEKNIFFLSIWTIDPFSTSTLHYSHSHTRN